MNIEGGALIWYGNGTITQNIVVNGDVTVAYWGAIDVWSLATSQSLSIGGSLINNTSGTIGNGASQTTSRCDFTTLPVTFFGSGTKKVTNTSGTPTTIFSTLTIDKGSSQADSLIIDISNTFTTPTDSWLTLKNGTLVYRRSNPATDFTISAATPFTIPETAGLYIDYPNNSNNRNILIANAANSASDLMLDGKLTVKAGNVYVGPTNGTTNTTHDIVYSGDGLSTLDIQGGNLRVNGQIRRSTATTTGAIKYYQSGGNVVINGQGADATALTRAKLEVVNTGSVFSMSDGTITIVRGSGTSYGDLYLRPSSGGNRRGDYLYAGSFGLGSGKFRSDLQEGCLYSPEQPYGNRKTTGTPQSAPLPLWLTRWCSTVRSPFRTTKATSTPTPATLNVSQRVILPTTAPTAPN